MRSTSQLAITSREASSSTERSNATYSRSQETGTFTSELRQAPQVVLPQQAQVREPVPEHRDPLEPEAEREAGDVVRVVADRLEHGGVDLPGAAHLDPAGVLADRAAGPPAREAGDVELDRGLREGAEARPDPDLALRPEERAREAEERALQIGERDSAVDGQPLDLVEDRAVGRVRRVAPVAAAERHHVDGRLVRLHVADLAVRGVRPEEHVVVQVKGVARRAGRVPDRRVERVEVVVGVLDLAAVEDLVAEAEEEILDLAPHLREQVEAAAPRRLARKRDVDDILGERALERRPLELELPLRD